MEGWTDFLPMALFVAVELLLRLIEKIPDRPKQKAETASAVAEAAAAGAEAAQTWQEVAEKERAHAQQLEKEVTRLRAERDDARARLARCKCGEGEGSP